MYTTLYVNNNGNVTFGAALPDYVATPIAPTGLAAPIIAPFWADIGTRVSPGQVSPSGTSTGANLVEYDLDVAGGVFTVTWNDVGAYANRTVPNAFQLQLVSRGNGDFDIVYRYEAINFTFGDASNAHARVGYSSNNGVAYELASVSGLAAVANIENIVGNTGSAGLYVFQVRGGQVSTSADDTIDGGAGRDTLVGGGTRHLRVPRRRSGRRHNCRLQRIGQRRRRPTGVPGLRHRRARGDVRPGRRDPLAGQLGRRHAARGDHFLEQRAGPRDRLFVHLILRHG